MTRAVGAGGTGVDLIVNQVMELEVVGIADGDQIVEGLAGTAVVQDGLAVLPQARQLQGVPDVLLVGAVEHGGGDLPAQRLGGVAQMDLQHLSDVHTGRHAQRVQHDVQRRAVGQEGHILFRQNAGNDALVAVTAGHLIAHGDLSLLGDIHPDGLGDAGSQLVGIFLGEDLDVHHDAAFAVGNLQRGIPDFSCLLAEDGSQQPLLGGQLGLALGGDLTNQDNHRREPPRPRG